MSNIPKGYKQTDVGVIPEDWKVKSISEVGEVKRGASSQQIKYLKNGGVRLIRINDFFNDNPVFVLPTDDIMRYKINKNDILFAGTGNSAGASCIVPMKWEGLPHSYNAPRIRINQNSNREYIFYCLQSNYIAKQQKEQFVGAAQPFLDTNAISNFKIAYPNKPTEQTAIAAALSDADALISSLEKLIAKKRNIKQGAMQELLTGKRRLPGFSGVWGVKKLGEITEIVSGGTPKTGVAAYWEGGIKWCTPTDITSTAGKYLFVTERTISALGLSSSSAHILPVGTLLLCSRATIGEVKIASSEICTNQGFKSLICGSGVNNEFLFYLLLTMKHRIVEKAIGSTFLEISKKDMALLEVSLPPLPEQTAIAAILTDMDVEIEKLEQKVAKYRQIKQGMMQELLTGKTRLI